MSLPIFMANAIFTRIILNERETAVTSIIIEWFDIARIIADRVFKKDPLVTDRRWWS